VWRFCACGRRGWGNQVQPQAILASTWQQLRRGCAVWAAGLLGAAGNVLLAFWLRQAARPALWRDPLQLWWEAQVIPIRPLLLWGGCAVLLSLLAWLFALRAEGVLTAVGLGLAQPWRAARRWLVSFVAVDTIVFLPLLLLALAVLALLVVLLGASLVAGLRSPDPRTALLGGWGITALCVTPLLLLTVPLTMVTLLLRVLAFRAVAAEGLGARPALRRAWSLIGQAPGGAALSALLLWGLAYVAGTALTTVFVLAHLASAVSELAAPRTANLTLLLQAALALLEWAPRAVLFAFLGLGWTYAYRQLAAGAAP
jgi:hypothetical protein